MDIAKLTPLLTGDFSWFGTSPRHSRRAARSAGMWGCGSAGVVSQEDGPGNGAREVPPQTTSQREQDAGHRHRILVVDDNQDSALSMSMVLKIMGNEVKVAYDGVMALQLAEEFRPDTIFMDIGMPKMNGYDACHLLREHEWARDIKIVALTGWGQEEDRRRAFESGFNHHLVKPVEAADIEKILDS